jgi:hypothetical protein
MVAKDRPTTGPINGAMRAARRRMGGESRMIPAPNMRPARKEKGKKPRVGVARWARLSRKTVRWLFPEGI